MTRLNLFLLALAMICAAAVVTSQHRARKAYGELQKEQEFARQLDVEWGQLQLEESTWAMHSRIEAEATTRLGMQMPGTPRTQVILPDGKAVGRTTVKDDPL
ncbi:cell division protein FtsL [Silvimonas sp. JCM 19000]